jgi:hypothetical protein
LIKCRNDHKKLVNTVAGVGLKGIFWISNLAKFQQKAKKSGVKLLLANSSEAIKRRAMVFCLLARSRVTVNRLIIDLLRKSVKRCDK